MFQGYPSGVTFVTTSVGDSGSGVLGGGGGEEKTDDTMKQKLENFATSWIETIAAKRKPPYCPPQASDKIASDEFMTRLAAIPAADRAKMNMTQAVTRILATKFPCR